MRDADEQRRPDGLPGEHLADGVADLRRERGARRDRRLLQPHQPARPRRHPARPALEPGRATVH
jgi:hypothetical protein